MEITLEWSKPILFNDIFNKTDTLSDYKTKGVYVWVQNEADSRKLNYIGRALGSPNLLHRQQQHYLDMICGRSVIPKEFRDSGKSWIPGNSEEYSSVLLNKELFKQLVEEAFNYLSIIEVRLCPLPNLEKDTISNIEAELIYKYKPWCNTRGIKSNPNSNVVIKHTGDSPFG